MEYDYRAEVEGLLSKDAHWNINKSLAKVLSIEGCVLLSEFLYRMKMYSREGNTIMSEGKDWFFLTGKKITEQTTLGEKPQRRLIKMMVDMGIIEAKLMGTPAKKYYHINYNKVSEVLRSSFSRKEEQESPEGQNIIKKGTKKKLPPYSNNTGNDISSLSSDSPSAKATVEIGESPNQATTNTPSPQSPPPDDVGVVLIDYDFLKSVSLTQEESIGLSSKTAFSDDSFLAKKKKDYHALFNYAQKIRNGTKILSPEQTMDVKSALERAYRELKELL